MAALRDHNSVLIGLASIVVVPATIGLAACSGKPEAPAFDATNDAPDEEDAESRSDKLPAGFGRSCKKKDNANSGTYAWQFVRKDNSAKCLSKGECQYGCNTAPRCVHGERNKKMACWIEGTSDDVNIYQCRRGAPSGPTPMECNYGVAASQATDGGPELSRNW